LYPDDLAAVYAAANPSLFTQIDVSVISVASEEDASTVLEAINGGSLSFEDAAKQYSQDGFAQEGGRAGVFYLYELQTNFSEAEQVNELFSVVAGSVTQAFKSPAGYAIYRVEQAPWIADFTDAQVLVDVKTYIGAKDSGVVATYLKEQAGTFSASDAARLDFAAAAKQAGLTVMDVGATPVNVGASNYLSGFSYTDPNGYLSAIGSDSDAMRILYVAEVGSVTEPIASGSAFVVARITGEAAQPTETSDYLRMIYPYLAQSQAQQDLIQAIFGSDLFVDDFITVFIEKIMGSAT
jgi:hypothetical protein